MSVALPTPDPILETGLAFWRAQTLLAAVELGLFTALADGPLTAEQLRRRLALHPRAMPDFADALLALGLLQREGQGPGATYANTQAAEAWLVRREPGYVGGWLEVANTHLYPAWGRLTESLRNGGPLGPRSEGRAASFEGIDAARNGLWAHQFQCLAQRFDFGRFASLADIGGASGQLACAVAARHPHLQALTLDLPAATRVAEGHVRRAGLAGRVQARSLDLIAEPFPAADVITLATILPGCDQDVRQAIVAKAHAALPAGGCLIAIDHLIDDERRHQAFGLLMSLNLLVECGEGSGYSGADFDVWARAAGFVRTEVIPLHGPAAAAVAWKAA